MIRTETPKELVQFAFVLPLLFFIWASALEFRCDRKSLRDVGRFPPIIVGALGDILLLLSVTLFASSPYSSVALSRAMALVSTLVAVWGILGPFRSRLASALILGGGVLLAFFWFFTHRVV